MREWIKRNLHRILLVLILTASAAVVIWLMPWFFSLQDPAVRETFKEQVADMGIKGVFLMLGIQMLQVVVAVLPGEPIELLMGMLYGTWGGLLLCMLGLFLGTCIIFYLVRSLGQPFVERLFSREKIRSLSFLKNTKKLESFTFLLFFLPGTPKDVLTYVAPLTEIAPSQFLLISTFARIPSVITSTYAGHTIIQGEWWKTILIFLIMGGISLGGIWINRRIMARANRRHSAKGAAAPKESSHGNPS